jgi:chromosome segregation ATPase
VTSSNTTDAQAKLLRQVETLQTQYALASENWQTLESTLNSRIAALEKERDDIAKRETDIRKKAREINAKARRFEEDLESEKDRASTFESDLNEQKTALAKMRTRLSVAEAAVAEAKTDTERNRKTWDKEMRNKLDEERARWRAENPPLPSPNPLSATASLAEHNHYLSAGSPTASYTNRKASDSGLMGLYSRRSNAVSRTYSSDIPPLTNDRPPSRRTPPIGYPTHPIRTNTGDSSQFSRDASSSHISGLGLNGGSIPPSASASMAPSIDIDDRDSTYSPHRTVNDLVSHSTMAAGPSVQLVERMSAAVRRLESEKAAAKEEHSRLLAQRDEAREEVVGMMREMEQVKKQGEKIGGLETELGELKTRYEACLVMLGEKSEEVEELRDDLEEVKKIYREVLLQAGSVGDTK